MSNSRCDRESGDDNRRGDGKELMAAFLPSISDHLPKFPTPLSCSVPSLPLSPTSPSIAPSPTPTLLSFTPSFLSPLPQPTTPPPSSLQEAVVNQVRLPQSLWSSLCPRSLAEAGVARRQRAADGGSAVNHCH